MLLPRRNLELVLRILSQMALAICIPLTLRQNHDTPSTLLVGQLGRLGEWIQLDVDINSISDGRKADISQYKLECNLEVDNNNNNFKLISILY